MGIGSWWKRLMKREDEIISAAERSAATAVDHDPSGPRG